MATTDRECEINPRTESTRETPKISRRGFGILAGLGAASLAGAYWLRDIQELLLARDKPVMDKEFERPDEEWYEKTVKRYISTQLLEEDTLRHKDKVKEMLETPNFPLWKGFNLAVKYFGELYFVNDDQYQDDYEGYFTEVFLPKIFELCATGESDVVAQFALIQIARDVSDGNLFNVHTYGEDVDDERMRTLFRHFRAQEQELTGRVVGANLIQYRSYINAESSDDPLEVLRLMRLNTEPTIGMEDQDISALAMAAINVENELSSEHAEVVLISRQLARAMEVIEDQRGAIGRALRNLCKQVQADELQKMCEALTDLDEVGHQDFWEKIGMGVGIDNKKRNALDLNDVIEQVVQPSQVWINYADLSAKEVIKKLKGDIEGETDVIAESFKLAREKYRRDFAELGKEEGLYKVFQDQMFNPKFRKYIGNVLGDEREEWREIEEMWEEHTKLIANKDVLVEKNYIEMSKREYDTNFQLTMNKGMIKAYLEKIREYPVLQKLADENDVWQMALVVGLRELSPIKVWVEDRSGPIAPHSITPFNLDGVLKIYSDITEKLLEKIPSATPMDVLNFLHKGPEMRVELSSSISKEELAEFFKWFLKEIEPSRERLQFGPYSAYHTARNMVSQLRHFD